MRVLNKQKSKPVVANEELVTVFFPDNILQFPWLIRVFMVRSPHALLLDLGTDLSLLAIFAQCVQVAVSLRLLKANVTNPPCSPLPATVQALGLHTSAWA